MIQTSRRPEYRRAVRTARKELRKKPALLALALQRCRDEYEKAKLGQRSVYDQR